MLIIIPTMLGPQLETIQSGGTRPEYWTYNVEDWTYIWRNQGLRKVYYPYYVLHFGLKP